MNSVLLHVDGKGASWVVVRCEVCADINKYPAHDSLVGPIECKACGTSMDLRSKLMPEIAKRPNVPADLLGLLASGEAARRAQADD